MRLRVQCAQDWPRNLANCPLLIATHSDLYASTLKNASESQKPPKEAFWHASHTIVHTAHAGSAWKFCQLSITYCYTQMQGEARNCKKRRFGALPARLCALRSQDQLKNLTNCPQLIATHSDFYASTFKNARGSQKLQKEAVWRALLAIVRTARTG